MSQLDPNNFRVYLRAIEPEDYLISYKWRNDHELMRGVLGVNRFISKETERKWVLRAIEENETGKAVRLAICTKDEDKHIGYIYLTEIDTYNRSCGGVGSIIGEQSYRGKGLIFEARYLLFKYAFLDLGINRITSRILEDNYPSLKAARKFGYTEEGILREAVYKRGKYRNVHVFSMLKHEFLSRFEISEETPDAFISE